MMKKHLLTIEIRPPMDACIASADNKMIARQMNKTVEILVGPHPEQYVWVLKLLKHANQTKRTRTLEIIKYKYFH